MEQIREIDVSKPIEDFFTKLDYKVRSEVKGCDVTATKNDEFIVIECKKSISLKLIYQAVDRQEVSDSVYIAVPIIDNKKLPNRKYLLKLLRRLEIGLLVVNFLKTKTRVEVVLEPKKHKKRRKLKKRASLISEINSRTENFNRGGSVKSKIMTAYKESSLDIVSILSKDGPMTTKELKIKGTCSKTYSILYKNFYGWFVKKEGRGVYGITDKGLIALKEYLKIKKNL